MQTFATPIGEFMATRYDLGDNSCRIAVTASDSITNIFNAISNFLVNKGWLRTNFSVSETEKTGYYTYKGNGIDGTSKFFTISVMPKEVGSLEIVALLNIHNESASVVAGSGFALSAANWSGRFFIKLNAANNIYIFANPRWALFTSQNTKYGVGGVQISSDDIIEYPYNNNNSYYYYWIALNSVWYSNQGSMETMGSVLDYKGSSLTVPSEYNYFKPEETIYYTHPSLDNYGWDWGYQTCSSRIESARLTANAKSVTGCLEVVSPTNNSINWLVDSVKISCDQIPDSDTRGTNLNMLSAQSGIGSPAIRDENLTQARMCGLFPADNDFSKLPKGKNLLKNPWNNQNIVSDIHAADINSNHYLGSALGLKITQADLSFTTSFLNEVWLKVDANWNLDPNGESKKFFVVPGGCEFQDYLPKRNWKWLNAEHEAVIPTATNFKLTYCYTSLVKNVGYPTTISTVDGWQYSPIYGYWVTGTVATKKYSHASYLIPA